MRIYSSKSFFAAVLCAVFSTSATAAQQQNNEKLDEAVDLIRQALSSSSVPGMVIGISDRDRLHRVIVHGYADLKTKRPVTEETGFAIGSISKSMTAIALLQLMEENRYDPTLPASDFLPWFSVKSAYGDVTGHHLLTHTASLPDDNLCTDSPAGTYQLRNYELPYAPGTHHWYSNVGYQALGFTLEAIEKAPYNSIIERRILTPLGMNASHGRIDNTQRGQIAESYDPSPADDSLVEAAWVEYSAGDGSVVSTVGDLSTYARFILNRGAGPDGRLISDTAFSLFTTPLFEGYAYGIEIRQTQQGVVYEHTGAIAGYRANLEAHMDEGYSIVTLRNGPIEPELGQWILDTIQAAHHNLPLKAPPAKPEKISASHYAGTYRNAAGQVLQFEDISGKLTLKSNDTSVELKRIASAIFRGPSDHPGNSAYIFGQASEDAQSDVTDVAYGTEWYVKDGSNLTATPSPSELVPYAGHYETYGCSPDPLRIFMRNGKLAGHIDGEMTVLVSLGNGIFRPAEPAFNPERIQFNTITGSKALALKAADVPAYRVETP